jgi:hypothetical protein
MSRTRLVPKAKLASAISRQPEFKKALREHAEAVKTAAERETPVGATEDTIHGYRITETPTAFRVGNTDFFFHLTEWGSANNPPYAPLRRGVIAAGLRLDESRV